MKRLVELDLNTRYALEVDGLRLIREARDLQEYLVALKPSRVAELLRSKVLPFTSAALRGSLKVPLEPHANPIHVTRFEDMYGEPLPPGFEHLYACFFNTAVGARADVEHKIERDGRLWAWMEFE
ncbi:hypothetical protein [Stagnimonas aquatica]|uniref:hypothetical protein n=1 Tax=Stagnimonas aquatica TaxID=2689987 RepID=UPI0011CD7903|nr:hypothetical protein [Stagnimonas aquatica]